MKRIIMMVLRNLPFIPMAWFKLCWYASHVDNYTEGERYALLKMIDRRANKGGNITIDAHGVENIPEESGFIFYPNHQGMYDVLGSLFCGCKKRSRGSSVFKAGICLYESLFDRQRGYQTVHAGHYQCDQRSKKRP